MNSGRIAIGFVIIVMLAGMLALKTVTMPSAFAATAENESTSASVTVNGFVSVTLFNGSVTFPNVDPGVNQTAANNNPMHIQVDPTTNVDVNVYLNGSQFIDGSSNTFEVGNMSLNISVTGTGTGNTSYTDSRGVYQTVPFWLFDETSPAGTGKNESLYHYISVPAAQTPNAYTAQIRICAQQDSAVISCA